jgi:hypothetical protein
MKDTTTSLPNRVIIENMERLIKSVKELDSYHRRHTAGIIGSACQIINDHRPEMTNDTCDRLISKVMALWDGT